MILCRWTIASFKSLIQPNRSSFVSRSNYYCFRFIDRASILCCMWWTNIRPISIGSGRLHMAWFVFALLRLFITVGSTTVLFSTGATSLLQNRLRKVSINLTEAQEKTGHFDQIFNFIGHSAMSNANNTNWAISVNYASMFRSFKTPSAKCMKKFE